MQCYRARWQRLKCDDVLVEADGKSSGSGVAADESIIADESN